MDRLAVEIQAHEAARPDDFDGREAMWMERENLRDQLRWAVPEPAHWVDPYGMRKWAA